MSVELLDKTRSINALLQGELKDDRVVFNDLCQILSDHFNGNVLVISKNGKVLGAALNDESIKLNSLIIHNVNEYIDEFLNKRLNGILCTKENVNLETLGFTKSESSNLAAIVTPILISGKRLGHLFIYRKNNIFSIDDIILSEYGASVVGLETMRADKEKVDRTEIMRANVKAALSTLSVTEAVAIKEIITNLPEEGGIVVTSSLSTKLDITRSIIVNAIKKFASAGIIDAHSGGMKGTYIKVTNKLIYDELKSIN